VTDFDALRPVRAAYGPEKYNRLVDIKTTYDPHNLFHRNPTIVPRRAD
jgi:FAD/FMN-containing dehydrogenase